MKKIFIACILFLALPAQAADFLAPKGEDGNITVSAAESYRNLYTAGAQVSVNGEVSGDLMAVGGMINSIGNIEEDATLVGGTVVVSGVVGGDLRAVGGNISINQAVDGDVVLAGGNITISASSAIGGDLVMAGGNMDVNAPVLGKANINGGNITINSRIDGDVTVRSSENITFGPNAEVLGKIVLYSNKKEVIADGAKIGEIERRELPWKKTAGRSGMAVARGLVVSMAAVFLAAVILLSLKKEKVAELLQDASSAPFKKLGLGFMALVLMPIAAFFGLVLMIGYLLSGVIFFVYLAMLVIASVLAASFTGLWIIRMLFKKNYAEQNIWLAALAGAIAMAILKMIPVVGWIVCFLVFLLALGAIAGAMYTWLFDKK